MTPERVWRLFHEERLDTWVISLRSGIAESSVEKIINRELDRRWNLVAGHGDVARLIGDDCSAVVATMHSK